MTSVNKLAAILFTQSQIITIIIVCAVLAVLIALNIFLIYKFRKLGERKLCTRQLQQKREELLQKLDDMRSGIYDFGEDGVPESAVLPKEEIAEAEEQPDEADEDDDDEEDSEEPVTVQTVIESDAEADLENSPEATILAVRQMSETTRARLGFVGPEYDRKRYYVRYKLGFDAKLREAEPVIQERYKAFVNETGLYKGVKVKDSFKQQRITKGNKTLGLLLFKGKTLCVAFALNPADYADTKYRGIDKSDKKRFAKTPMMLKLTSERRLEYAKYLLVQVADANTIIMNEQPVEREFDFSQKTRDELFVERKIQITVLGEAPELDYDEEPVEEIASEEPEIEVEEQVEEVAAVEPEAEHEQVETPQEDSEESDDEPEEVGEQFVADDELEVEEEVAEEQVLTVVDGVEQVVVRRIRYNRSFIARVTQSGDELKARYSELKNELLSYKKVKSNLSWKRESFRFGRNTFACFVVRGKTLCLCLATDPKRFDETKYKVIDLSVRSPKSKQPCMYRITSDRRVKFAKQIIEMLMQELGTEKNGAFEAENYVMPYRSTEALIGDDLIRVIGEADAMPTVSEQIVHEEEAVAAAEVAEEPIVEEQPSEDIVEEPVNEQLSEEDETDLEEAADELIVEDEAATEEPEEEVAEEEVVTVVDGVEQVIVRRIRYNRSFIARVTQSGDEVKARYSELKNELLSYKKVKSNLSWKRESFRFGRNTFACFVVRGKTLCLCLATDPKRFDGTKYKVIDLSVRSPKSKQPCMYRITSDRRVKFAKQIIAMLMQELGTESNGAFEAENYVMPYRSTEALIGDDLIRVIGEETPSFENAPVENEPEVQNEQPVAEEVTEEPVVEEPHSEEVTVELPTGEPVEEPLTEEAEEQPIEEVAEEPAEEIVETPEIPDEEELPERDFEILEEVDVSEADVMSDEEAKQFVEDKVVKKQKSSGKKKGIVNIDSLSNNFEAGSHVTVESLREKHLIANEVTYIKVLAKGNINKPLIVEADDFSLQAVKMIVLTGGRVIRRKIQ